MEKKTKPTFITPSDGFVAKKVACKKLGCNWNTLRNEIRYGKIVARADGKINLEEAEAVFKEKTKNREIGRALTDKKKEAEIAKLESATRINILLERKQKGELHSIKDCCMSLGAVLSANWIELTALPARLQAMHPEIPGLDKDMVTLLNELADRLQSLGRDKGATVE